MISPSFPSIISAELLEGAGEKRSNATKALGDLLGDPMLDSRKQHGFTYCSWFMVDLWLICGWFVVDLWLIYGWFMVGLWYGWFMVDELLGVQFHGYFVENTRMISQLSFLRRSCPLGKRTCHWSDGISLRTVFLLYKHQRNLLIRKDFNWN